MPMNPDDKQTGSDRGGDVARLLVEYRQLRNLSQSQLAEAAQVSRSRISAAEAGTSQPTLDLCIRLASTLEMPLEQMVKAHLVDSLQDHTEALVQLENSLWGGGAHWSAIAEHHGLTVEKGSYVGHVSPDGTLKVQRRVVGCRATRARDRIVFRDRVIGEQPPSFAVKGSPRGLGYNMHVSVEGGWAVHQIEFARPWVPEDGPFDFEFETTLPQAYVLDLETYNARQTAEGLEPSGDWRGDYRWAVTYPFDELEFSIVFPATYRPEWLVPTATWGNAPLADSDCHELDHRNCRSWSIDTSANSAKLVLQRPVPGFTFGIGWKPVAWQREDS